MKSIRTKLVLYFMLIVIITVVILEVFLVSIIRQNYYKNLENSLVNQIKVSSNIYLRYYSDATIYENVQNDVDTFWKQTTAQVEIIDISGKVLMDSLGVKVTDVSGIGDVKEALDGRIGKWIGKVDYDDADVMAVSCPLKSGTVNVGVLRFITSLRDVNKEVRSIAGVFIIIGIAVILVCGLLGVLLSNSILVPLKRITRTAEIMASGDYKTKCEKKHDDEIGKLSDTLNHMAEEIVKKEQLKNEFISSISHELRTPLTSIKGWAITLKNGYEDTEMMEDGLDIIEKECDRLTGMVEELLDFSKFLSGKETIKKEEVFIEEILDYVRIQVAPRAVRDNVKFSLNGENAPTSIIADKNRLKQVFVNILDNAFRFTPPGGTVDFNTSYEGDYITFSIKDSGCGISPEELPRVKEKFYKGKNSKSRNGIGLSICDELVRLMGGNLDMESEVGIGTTVLIKLPIKGGG